MDVELSVVVPTYEERENLPVLLERLAESLDGCCVFEVVVVDDDSPDGTWRVAEELARTRYPWLRVVRRVGERGLASAVIRGFRESRGRFVVVMDADLQHPPELVPVLYRVAVEEGADVVVASRYARGGGVEGWSRLRLLMSRGATLLSHLLVPESRATSDPMSGFFLVRRGLLEGCLGRLRPRGYKILLEVLARCRPGRVVDVPFVFRRRLRGESKLGASTIMEFVIHLLELNGFRLPKMMVVGASGVLVLWAVNTLLAEWLGVPRLYSYAVAVEASILNNFLWNSVWTFRGRGRGKSVVRRLAEYHGAVAAGALVNYGVYQVSYHLLGLGDIISILLGVGLGFLSNYLLAEHLVWGPGARGRPSREGLLAQEARRGWTPWRTWRRSIGGSWRR